MSYPYSVLITEVTGNVLSATDYNNEHQNHINNNIPASIDDDSANVAGMQTTVDPYPASAESLATDLKGELERLRYAIKDIKNTAQWYMVSPQFTKLLTYRRPVLQFGSITTVAVEAGLDGTSGNIPILFPDGQLRTETSTTNTTFVITRNVALSGTTQSGLRASLSEAANTTYYLYAVKVTDNATKWVTVGDTLAPVQANYASLNSNFGTSGWVYLGAIRNGNGSGGSSDILDFVMTGNTTKFKNTVTTGSIDTTGFTVATSASNTTLTYTYTSADMGVHLTQAYYFISIATVNAAATVRNTAATRAYGMKPTTNDRFQLSLPAIPTVEGINISVGSAAALDIMCHGFIDGVLGVGANPLL